MTLLAANCLNMLLVDLLDKGFQLKIVGHSLGAAVTAVVLMELKKTLVDCKLQSGTGGKADGGKKTAKSANSEAGDGNAGSVLQNVRTIIYGCPPVITTEIADQLYKDNHIVACVNGHDMVQKYKMHS